MVATRARNYGPLVRSPPRHGRKKYRLSGLKAIWDIWDRDLKVMTDEGECNFSEIRRGQYPQVREWARENLDLVLPQWDPLTQLAPPTIPRGIVNGLEVRCGNLRSYRILWVEQQGQEVGHEFNIASKEFRDGQVECTNDNTDCQFNENLDFMRCQGQQYGVSAYGGPCNKWVCTDCAEYEYKQWDFSLDMSRILVHCWDCSQDAAKSGSKTGDKSYAEQFTPNVNPDKRENDVVWAKDAKGYTYMVRDGPQTRRHCGCRKRFAPVAHPKKRGRPRSYHLCSRCRQGLYARCMKTIVSNCEDPELGVNRRQQAMGQFSFLVDWVDDGDHKNRNHCRCNPPAGPRDWPEILRSYRNLDKEQRFTKGFRMCLYCKLPTRYNDATGGHTLEGQSSAWW